MKLERTTKYVLLKVTVLHQPGVDPEVICEQAEFGYNDTDGAVEGGKWSASLKSTRSSRVV